MKDWIGFPTTLLARHEQMLKILVAGGIFAGFVDRYCLGFVYVGKRYFSEIFSVVVARWLAGKLLKLSCVFGITSGLART